jgi:hypothetical protein
MAGDFGGFQLSGSHIVTLQIIRENYGVRLFWIIGKQQ